MRHYETNEREVMLMPSNQFEKSMERHTHTHRTEDVNREMRERERESIERQWKTGTTKDEHNPML